MSHNQESTSKTLPLIQSHSKHNTNPNHTKGMTRTASHQKMALTFGTLLSSQETNAHHNRPHNRPRDNSHNLMGTHLQCQLRCGDGEARRAASRTHLRPTSGRLVFTQGTRPRRGLRRVPSRPEMPRPLHAAARSTPGPASRRTVMGRP